jgi:cell division protein DivIC
LRDLPERQDQIQKINPTLASAGNAFAGDAANYMKILTHIPSFLKNRYLLTAAGFVIWILFFDSRDLITSHFREGHQLLKLEESKKYYELQIAMTKRELEQLKTNPAVLERYAREKFLMKREKEDLFRIREDSTHTVR